jgi:hypothetical protein
LRELGIKLLSKNFYMKKIWFMFLALFLTTAAISQTKQPEKKADKRFKENKKSAETAKPKTKKDGTPDMRYKENKDTKKKS